MADDVIKYQEIKPYRKKLDDIEPVRSKKSYFDNENIKFFTETEFKKLVSGSENQFTALVFLLLYETGARVQEARYIKFNDIDDSNGRVKVLTLKQRNKGKIYRYLKISDKLHNLILIYQKNNNLLDMDFVLARKQGGLSITQQGIDKMIKREVLKTLGADYLDKAHAHALRHTRSIHLLDSGMNIMLLKNFLGHANIVNTLIYLKYSNRDMAEAIDKANNEL
ncbi:MAG: tyrosine-type recombinase/integrase [bacterium]